jgi:deoxyhypusine synthase
MYKMILSGVLEQYYEIPRNSWMIAAAEKNLPIVVPGWEDSTMGNIFASYCIKGELKFYNEIRDRIYDLFSRLVH